MGDDITVDPRLLDRVVDLTRTVADVAADLRAEGHPVADRLIDALDSLDAPLDDSDDG